MSDINQSGVETFQRCFPQNSGKFCTLINTLELKVEADRGEEVETDPGEEEGEGKSNKFKVVLSVKIVAKPVEPTPEAAYALLRAYNSQPSNVECARFAWGPEPSRIELFCPMDLRGDLVRRRAVFHWIDSTRSANTSIYKIQKITKTGSTHFPEFSSDV